MLGPAGKPTEPPSSPNNPLRKFTGKITQVALQLSSKSKSMPKLRTSSSKLLNSSERMSSGSSTSLATANSYGENTGLILYYDETCPKDNLIYDSRKKLSIEKDIPKIKYSILNDNLLALVDQFQQVKVLNCFQSLVNQLFSYKDCSFTTLIYVENDESNLNDTIKFISSQFSHIPGLFIVLNDYNKLWPTYSRLGASDVWNKSISSSKISFWNELISSHRNDQFQSRTKQLKTLLGLESECSNIMSKFTVPNLPNYNPKLSINNDRLLIIKQLVGSWDFYAHDLKYDELLIATYLMIKHALDDDELVDYNIPDQQILTLLYVVRNCYQASNPYHNFRHAVDVVQATFYFLITIGVIKKVDNNSFKNVHLGDDDELNSNTSSKSTTNSSSNVNKTHLKSIDGLAILIAALGHDVGHPGVTNAFLVSANAPLAKIYNDRSVLESFHSAAFNQILKKYWPQLITNINSRTLITESVLATDMAVHFDYMKKAELKGIESIPSNPTAPEDIKNMKILLACLILKCADISNVSRKLDISSKWGTLLIEEFGGINDLEIDLGLKQPPSPSSSSQQVTPQYRNKLLGEGQIFFIETYALPLFSAVSRMIPEMNFATDHIQENVKTWKLLIKDNE